MGNANILITCWPAGTLLYSHYFHASLAQLNTIYIVMGYHKEE